MGKLLTAFPWMGISAHLILPLDYFLHLPVLVQMILFLAAVALTTQAIPVKMGASSSTIASLPSMPTNGHPHKSMMPTEVSTL